MQEGADWLYAQFYRADRILLRFVRSLFTCGWVPALLGLKLNLTYRYDNRRERIQGHNPAAEQALPARTRPPLLSVLPPNSLDASP